MAKLTHAILIDGGNEAERSERALALLKEHFSDDPFAADKLEHGVFEDLLVLEPEEGKKDILVHQIEELISLFKQKPLASTGKACIIPRGERLNEQSQNKLLKLLEEPASGDVVIIMVQNGEQLFSTVRSRCMRIWLGYEKPVAGEISDDVKALAAVLIYGRGGSSEAWRILSQYEGDGATAFLRAFQLFLRSLLAGRVCPGLFDEEPGGGQWLLETAAKIGEKQTERMRKGVQYAEKALYDIERGYRVRYVVRGMALEMLRG